MIEIGKKVDDFSFKATSNLSKSLSDYQGQTLVLFFYPKDATPGCTTEGQNFRDAYDQLQSLNTELFGVSRDSLKSHEQYKQKQNFPYELISDSEEHLCALFDVIKLKSMYGKQVLGIERSTFIINPQQILTHAWRKVKVAGHVDEVLATLKNLSV